MVMVMKIHSLFKTLVNNGSIHQGPLRIFGEEIATPQDFQSAVNLKKRKR